MTNYAHGHEAEKVAAAYLKKRGYNILEVNWRRPRAEIDIVARPKRGPVTFVEVKYRETSRQGSGLDYITPQKLKQMQFAAELWVAENRYDGAYTLGAIDVRGTKFEVVNFLTELTI